MSDEKLQPFDDLFGMVKTTRTVSLEEIEQALSQQGLERFNNTFDRKLSRLHGAKLVEGEL